MSDSISLRFPQGQFAALRESLLEDRRREAFALLFGRMETAGDRRIVKIVAAHYPTPEDYQSQSLAHLRLKREYVYQRLVDMQRRGDVDTVIDVHTHPFCAEHVAFSGVDDADERAFFAWLNTTLDNVHYASIVLSQSDYAARMWEIAEHGVITARSAFIKTQTLDERWQAAGENVHQPANADGGFMARSVLALGLDVVRQVMHGQSAAIVGVGGLGSVIAENLLHSGFQHLHLIDHDCVEITNLNRIVGATRDDAERKRLKVDAVKNHLQAINPDACIEGYALPVEDPALLPVLADTDWIIVCTDNHASRFKAQEIALRYSVPLISAGVNISVEDGRMIDMSGEVIIARSGDRLCLNCLGRINPTKIAAERHQGQTIGEQLVQRGYVTGRDVKEPAVKTLNAMIGALAVDALLNQYTQRQPHVPIWVYENNSAPCFYPDAESVAARPLDCFHCSDR